jgi:hypothetical protein
MTISDLQIGLFRKSTKKLQYEGVTDGKKFRKDLVY